jgi:dTDP-4-dehydrorhamnose reductase
MIRVAVLGSRGRLGAALVRNWSASMRVAALARPALDLADLDTLDRTLRSGDFDVVVNCAANTAVDACESTPDDARRVNSEAPGVIATACMATGGRLIHISTDYVFDGAKRTPYTENDPTSPQGVYATTKRDGEFAVLATSGDHLVVRVSWVFGPDKPSFIDMILDRAASNDRVEAIADKWSTPTYTEDLAAWLPALFAAQVRGGIYHVTNAGSATWLDYGQHALDCARTLGVPLKTATVEPIKLVDFKAFIAPRGIHTVLSTAKFTAATGIQPTSWEDAVERYVRFKFRPTR